MILTICGGGNLGHVIAAFAAHRGYEVRLLTRHPERWSQDITIDTPDGKLITGHISRISNRPEEVIPQSDIILLCLPGYAIADCLRGILKSVECRTESVEFATAHEQEQGSADTTAVANSTLSTLHSKFEGAIGSVVSSTGFFFEALKILPPTTPLFGFQRVPFIARVKEYGRSAHLLGYKPQLSMAVEHLQDAEPLRQQIEQLLDTPVELLASHYEASLTNSNPLLHTSRLFTLWHDWHEGVVYPTQSRFYADWTDEASQLLIDMDREFFRLLDVLPVRPGSIPTILDYYESHDAASLTRKLRSIPAFRDILSPMKRLPSFGEGQGDGPFIPDFQSRYFTEDFPYGLAIIRRLMQEHHIAAPHIEKVYQWGIQRSNSSFPLISSTL